MKYALSISVIIFIAANNFVFAANNIRDFSTTRMMSTSDAGVGAILVNESSFLNPASIAFFSDSSIYYQKNQAELDETSQERNDASDSFKSGEEEALVIADTSGRLKGTFSYQRQRENGSSRIRYTSSFSRAFAKGQSFGLLYRYTMDRTPSDHSDIYHQVTFGYSFIRSNKLSFGLIVVDPFSQKDEDVRAIAGLQYQLVDNLFLLLDAGTNYALDAAENTLTRMAFQVSFYRGFFLRLGKYYDNSTNFQGQSWGISWVGPRLSIDYAYRTTEQIEKNTDYLYADEQLIEQSFALSLRF
jgi:hypothetical protein